MVTASRKNVHDTEQKLENMKRGESDINRSAAGADILLPGECV